MNQLKTKIITDYEVGGQITRLVKKDDYTFGLEALMALIIWLCP